MVSIKEILAYLRSENIEFNYIGKEALSITGFSSLTNYKEGTITWIKKQSAYDASALSSVPTLVIVQQGVKTELPNVIETNSSKTAFFGILEHFFDSETDVTPIGKGTFISPRVKLGDGVTIGHNCTIDGDIVIGDGTRIYNNVVLINRMRIGENCIIQSGVSIGHDGFGYTEDEDHTKTMVKHYGGVTIGDNVYIGSNTCIERGTIDDTVIETGTKIDMCCLIGHNSIIKQNCALVGGTLLLGSVHLDENAYVASALLRNQCHVGENGFVGLGSVVTKDVPSDTVVAGVPAKIFKKSKLK